MFTKTIIATLALSLSVSATVFQVNVGQNNTLSFVPNVVTAKPGDKVQFNFLAANHSVASSSANSPCTAGQNAIFSGFQPVGVGKPTPQFTVPITSNNPVYIYCSQTKAPSHCQSGMVMIINPLNGNAIGQYLNKATSAGTSTSPKGGISGGTIVNNAAGTKPSQLVGVTPSASPKAKAGTAGAKAKAKASAAAKKGN